MTVYRAAKEKWCEDLSGEGARLAGGRWNNKQTPVVYASEHRSLCCLELLVHIPLHTVPENLMLISIHIPESFRIRTITMNELPESWDNPAPDPFTREIGDQLLKDADYGVIRVPSSVIPQEKNILLNPRYSRFDEVFIHEIEPLNLDRYFAHKNL